MILLLTLATLVTFLLPGLAAVHLAARSLDAEKKFVVAPAISLALYGLAGLAGWAWPHQFRTISLAGVFEFALELTVKAHVRGWRVEETPTTWTDRTAGDSRFRLAKWLPKYMHWYGMLLRFEFTRHRGRHARAIG